MPPALLARPAGLENVSVPREQTFEQAAALCPAVCRAAIHPAGELETAQDARTPPYPASKADRRAPQSPALEALWVKSGYFPPVRGFPTSLGSLPPPRTSREPWSRVGFTPPCRAAAGVRALGSAAWASPDAEPHAEGLPTSCRVVQDTQQPCASRQPRSPIRTDPLGYCFALWHLSPSHHAVLMSSAGLVLDVCSQWPKLITASYRRCRLSFPPVPQTDLLITMWVGRVPPHGKAGSPRKSSSGESVTGGPRGAVGLLHPVLVRLNWGNRVLFWPHQHRRDLDDLERVQQRIIRRVRHLGARSTRRTSADWSMNSAQRCAEQG